MPEDTFIYPTYIVLDLPPKIVAYIQAVRKIYDPDRATLSAEVSLSGSCGIGAIAPGQEEKEVFVCIDRFAAAIAPFESGFSEVKGFRHTGIYYFTMRNPDKFIDLHRRLVATGICFTPNPWPFEPHCTLTLRNVMPDELALQLLQTPPPSEHFILDTLSVYQLPIANTPQLLHRIRLGN